MSLFPDDILSTAEAIIRDFTAAGLMISTAESCTGGLIAGALTEISGSSAVVDRGFITYTNSAKIEMLGVQTETLLRFGAVSEETARQMVHGALFRSRAEIAVAVTGIAGPVGGSAEKPVGLVHLAAKSRAGALIHRQMLYGDIGRSEVRLATIRTALEMVRSFLAA
ncbi:CinA family protein [Rhizobium leguminosarum bv. viciae]|uniref:CinA family protein n=2 Tax=Rhizobium/Agrobacterium group TaxID=227290 RepID=A0A8G2J0E4_RHILV|nr:CinA family protein [Rhizobium leguminosarum]MBY5338783.1 CinA family protein [Rhizobium leguminosarum]MBY5422974.1 CinA family protein [Rhizobium leguminosarum]NEH44411.1 nicotinamide-nucleotide amidohydrolase family protein [Rhizobium leguminosarum]NEI00805.1 nicotinamide-nucleotide amidohydrolase family protein [Rhizobium leguminosarum]NEI55924.1 nicotinamide-nucleotide amidohydrolase family protein [Rhizobium leguminosarum]